MDKYDCLKLENQLCFPLYACSKEIVRKYKPFLDELDLTYTQYITMMVLWDKKQTNVKELGKYLFLDSGTLTPVLKKLEAKGYITRHRSAEDERNLIVKITDRGVKLREKAYTIPEKMGKCVNLNPDDFQTLYTLLYKILNNVNSEENQDTNAFCEGFFKSKGGFITVIQINGDDQKFEEEVLKSDKPVLVDFWATWCGPCKMLSPIVDELSEEVATVKFVGVDVDQSERLAIKYGISSIPCLVLFKDGEEVKRTVGVQPKPALAAFIQ